MTKQERKKQIIDIHKRAIEALTDDESTSPDMFVLRVDALDQLLAGAMSMIELMYLFEPGDSDEQQNPYF